MKIFIISVVVTLMLLNAFVLWCLLRAGAMADQQEHERMMREYNSDRDQ